MDLATEPPAADSSAAEPAKASRRRGAELEDAILDAAWTVLTESGYTGFTYEAVAAQAGTSRPVLYRRWPQRDDLLVAALARYGSSQPVPVPDTGDLRQDAIALLRNFSEGRAYLLTIIGAQLVAYFRESGTSLESLRERLMTPGRVTGPEQIVARAVARGELPDIPRSRRVVNLPSDLMRHDMLMSMRPVPDAAIIEIVDDVWLPLLRSRTGTASGGTSGGTSGGAETA